MPEALSSRAFFMNRNAKLILIQILYNSELKIVHLLNKSYPHL